MPMALTIRPFAAEDQEAVIALWQDCLLVVPQNDPALDIRAKVRFQPDLFLVALLDGGVVGTVMAGYEGHRGWINYLAVAQDRRCQGIGRALMSAAEAALQALGCPKINLQVRRTNSAVIAFYRALGFREDEVVSLGKRL
jgi:ribosomal protein S18 acetylase RimI-like enzyme